jgi:hypothetical protein
MVQFNDSHDGKGNIDKSKSIENKETVATPKIPLRFSLLSKAKEEMPFKIQREAKQVIDPTSSEAPIDEGTAEAWFMLLATADEGKYNTERMLIKKEIDKIEEGFEGSKQSKRVTQYLSKVFNKVETEVLLLQRQIISLELELDELEEKKEIKLKEHLSSSDKWGKRIWEMIQKYAPKIVVPIVTSVATLKASDFFKVLKEVFTSAFGTSGDLVLASIGMLVGFIATDVISNAIKSSRVDNIFKECTGKKKEIIEQENKLLETTRYNVKKETKKLKNMYFPETLTLASVQTGTAPAADVATTAMMIVKDEKAEIGGSGTSNPSQ